MKKSLTIVAALALGAISLGQNLQPRIYNWSGSLGVGSYENDHSNGSVHFSTTVTADLLRYIYVSASMLDPIVQINGYNNDNSFTTSGTGQNVHVIAQVDFTSNCLYSFRILNLDNLAFQGPADSFGINANPNLQSDYQFSTDATATNLDGQGNPAWINFNRKGAGLNYDPVQMTPYAENHAGTRKLQIRVQVQPATDNPTGTYLSTGTIVVSGN